jgi:hypothetical protein
MDSRGRLGKQVAVFGAPVRKPGRAAPFDQASTASDLNSFGALWIIDVGRGRGTTIETENVSKRWQRAQSEHPRGTNRAARANANRGIVATQALD